MPVSVGQAACNALAAYLTTEFGTTPMDVTVNARWPTFGPNLPSRVISIIPVGRRQRLDVQASLDVVSRTNLNATTACVGFRLGSYIQPIQLDVWARYDTDRDEVIAQLDNSLTAGLAQTLDPTLNADPVRDGIVLALLDGDGFTGNVEFWFDEPDIGDAPDSVVRGQWRATYSGEARGVFYRSATVPRLLKPTLALAGAEGAIPPATPADTTSIFANQTPPPAFKITHGTE